MTILDAIKADVSYPLSDNAFELALIKRGLTSADTVTAIITASEEYELAVADCLMSAATSPDVKEGGYSVSMSDKKNIIARANGIYSKYGISSSLKPTAKFVNRW